MPFGHPLRWGRCAILDAWTPALATEAAPNGRFSIKGKGERWAGPPATAKRFLGAALKRSREWIPRVINTDKNPAYGEAIAELKRDGAIPPELEHRQAKYLNDRLECDHGKLKRLIRPTLGFQSMRTARRATIKGFEVMRRFKKGQFRSWIEAVGGGSEARFISRLFGLAV